MRARGLAVRFDDLYTVSGLLPAAALKEKRKPMEQRETARIHGLLLSRRKFCNRPSLAVFGASLLFLAVGGFFGHRLKTQFFPDDVQYLSFLDVWLPNDVPLTVTNHSAIRWRI